MKALFAGINNLYLTVNDFRTALTGGFYLNTAPQGSTKPYGVFQLVGNVADYNFSSTFEDATIQIDLFDTDADSNILDVAEKCMALFDDCDLTVTGYQFGKMEREINMMVDDAEEGVQRYMIQYLVQLRKTN